MKKPAPVDPKWIANYDPERKGIFIHSDQLAGSPFKTGDRFSLRRGKNEIFSITIVLDAGGDIFFDKSGIFIPRSRRIDILLGGIFDQFVFYIEPDIPRTIKLRPLEIVMEPERRWT